MGVGWTSIGALSEVWVGGRRGAGSGSDWGEHLRTTGPGPCTTLDLTHVKLHISLYNLVTWTIKTFLNDNNHTTSCTHPHREVSELTGEVPKESDAKVSDMTGCLPSIYLRGLSYPSLTSFIPYILFTYRSKDVHTLIIP